MDCNTRFAGASFKVKNFMCFGEEPQGFNCIKPINLIIGRNNSGKTALIEMLEYATQNSSEVPESLFHNGTPTKFQIEKSLTAKELQQVFQTAYTGQVIINSQIKYGNHGEIGKSLVGEKVTIIRNHTFSRTEWISISVQLEANHKNNLLDAIENPIKNKSILRLTSERDIVAESANFSITLQKNGAGATRILHEIMNAEKYATFPEAINFVKEINRITMPDLKFTKIEVKKDANEMWEAFLTEDNKVPIKLSRLGSGLKTVILTLLVLNIIPKISPELAKQDRAELMFVFEEIENYLHPAIQRRLLDYIREYMLKNNSTAFITSHSNVTIDMFSKDNNAQIIHVQACGKESNVAQAKTYIQHRGILDDLDIRASDILQSNGVIWVEDPSDRIYLNHWISLLSKGMLQEGTHYQIVFYGGRLLSHLSGLEPGDVGEWIGILSVNKNAAILIDSDKKSETEDINDTKKRLVDEMNKMQGFAWVTDGKEIENYIPSSVIKKMFPKTSIQNQDKYSSFFDLLNNVETGRGDYYLQRKPILAEKVIENFELSDIQMAFDLEQRLSGVCDAIYKWNNIDCDVTNS